MSKLQDTIKAIRNKFCPYIKAIRDRLSPCIVKIGQYFQSNIGTQQDRFKLYLWTVGFGVVTLILLLITGVTPFKEIFSSIPFLIFLLTLPAVTFNWWLKNHDQLQQFKDTKQQQEHTSEQIKLSKQQQTETLFSNALQLLLVHDDIFAKSIGLKELMRLYQTTEDESLNHRINLITASGLQLEKAKLQEADLERANMEGINLQEANLLRTELQGTDLQRANLQGADLRLADLQGALLQEANLQGTDLSLAILKGAIWNEKTEFPKGFDPTAHGMVNEDDLLKDPNG